MLVFYGPIFWHAPMDESSQKEKLPQEIFAVCAMNAVLHTEGVAEMAPLPALSKEIEGTKGVRINEVEDIDEWIEAVTPVKLKYGEGYEDLIEQIDAMR